jgi:Tfp pilus assembly protein FimT
VLHYAQVRQRDVTPKRRVTAVEILIAASAVFVLVVLAVPPLNNWTARSQLKSAREILEASVVNARQTARIYQTEVVLSVQDGQDDSGILTYSVISPQQSDYTLDFQEKKYHMPTGVRLTSDRDIIRFNAHGTVEPPAQLVLVSTDYESIREHILLQ